MILFALIALFFYWHFIKINWGKEDIYLEKPLYLGLVILLIPINWLFEWLKWKATLNVLEIHSTQKDRVHAFFAGIVTGMLTPNMLGNFIGRMYYFPRSQRVSLIILTLVTNYAQFISSIVFGILGILFLEQTPLELDVSNVYGILLFVLVFLVVFYFNFEWLFRFWKRKVRVLNLIRNLKRRRSFRWSVLLLSSLRHGIFTLQFLFMLHAFGEEISINSIWWIWQVYLWVTIAPSLFLGKLAIRESISIWVLSVAGMGELTILISSFLIWTFNLLLPTLIGLLICERKRA